MIVGLTVKSYKDAEAGINCQIIAVAHPLHLQRKQIYVITIIKSILKNKHSKW